MTALSSFAASVLSLLVFSSKNGKAFAAVAIGALLFLSIPLASIQKSDAQSDAFYRNYGFSTDFGAASTVWSAGDPTGYPKAPVEAITGNARLKNYTRQGTLHSYTIESNGPSTALDNTLYFPGWNVYIDNIRTLIEFQDPNHRGLITFSVPSGNHTVEVVFKETRVRQITNVVSLLSLGFVIVFLLSVVIPGLTRNPAFIKDGSRLRGRDDK